MSKQIILSIDDSKAVHAFIQACLPSYEMIHAMDGKQGLQILETTNQQISLVLLDWEMPGMIGPEVLKVIKQRKPDLPVIMLTSKNEPEDIKMVLGFGAAEYVLKPFTSEILNEKIQSVLEVQ